MHRNNLLNLLETYQPFDKNEDKMLKETIRFVEENATCFERFLEKGHITGSAWILDKTKTFALLTHHKKLAKWFQTGGHCDGDSDVLNVAMKEAEEESGYKVKVLSEQIFDVDVHLIPESIKKNEPAHFHYDIRFLLETDKNLPFAVSDESTNLAWISLNEIENYNNSDSILRMVKKCLAQNFTFLT